MLKSCFPFPARGTVCLPSISWIRHQHHLAPPGWTQMGSHYTRPFDPFKTLFDTLCHDPARPGFRSLDAVVSARLDTDLRPERVEEIAKQACMKIRHLHPGLAAHPSCGKYQYRALSNQSSANEWLAKTFFILKEPGDGSPSPHVQDLAVAAPSATVRLYYLPHEQQFILRANHMLTDGDGLTMVFQDFFAEMDQLAAGERRRYPERPGAEVQRLPTGTFHAAGVDRLSEECLQSFQASLAKPQATGEACEIAATYDALEFNPRGHSQALEFSIEETKCLVKTSKSLRLGFTPLIHGALVHAANMLGGKKDSAIHSTLLIFNSRNQCRDSLETPSAQAAALRIGFWPVQLTMGDEMCQTAASFKEQYDVLARQKLPILASMVPHLENSVSIVGKNYFNSILPSFIGNLSDKFPERYRSFKVREFWMLALPTDTRTYVGIQTFGSRLTIRLAYDERFHSDEQMAEYLRLIKHQLCLPSPT